MGKLGIVVDSLQIQEIEDTTGYINNIAAPYVAMVASRVRIASARADQEASEPEQNAEALKAQFVRDSEITRTGLTAEIEKAKAAAAQDGALSEAKDPPPKGVRLTRWAKNFVVPNRCDSPAISYCL